MSNERVLVHFYAKHISVVLNEDTLTGSRYVDEFGDLSKKSKQINIPRQEQKI